VSGFKISDRRRFLTPKYQPSCLQPSFRPLTYRVFIETSSSLRGNLDAGDSVWRDSSSSSACSSGVDSFRGIQPANLKMTLPDNPHLQPLAHADSIDTPPRPPSPEHGFGTLAVHSGAHLDPSTGAVIAPVRRLGQCGPFHSEPSLTVDVRC
jgi:hypothetical protein